MNMLDIVPPSGSLTADAARRCWDRLIEGAIMTNDEAAARASELWGCLGWVCFDSRRIPRHYSVGANQIVLGWGNSWEEAFESAEAKR